MKETITAIIIFILIAISIFVGGYRTAEMKYEGTSIYTYAPESIND